MHFHLPLVAVCLVGFLLSSYAYTVEHRAERAKQLGTSYRAACDIGPFSCTKVFSSEFGSATQLLGLPKISNAAVGMLYYSVEMICCWHPTLILVISAPSILATAILAFILTVILHDVCVVCCSIYIVNVVTVWLAYRWWRRTNAPKSSRAKKNRS